jgi:tetraacyldisaccharide 4'-kinase
MTERPRFWRRGTPGSATVRLLLSPLGLVYGLVMRARNWMYDRALWRTIPTDCPTVSVGNVSVGGTGKTPITAWLAAQLAESGARPGIVLRGVGGDERLVLSRLVPTAIVVVDPDRVAGVREAVAAGARVAVLDDAFQHRRAGRQWDIALVSADAEREVDRVIPVGPLREPLVGLRRAGLVIVTRKAASDEAVTAVLARVRRAAPAVPVAVVSLVPDALFRWSDGARRPLSALRGATVAAISGIGDPAAFERQLSGVGARVTGFRFGDHHAFTTADASSLMQRLPAPATVVCTLKDAVKLGPLWPDPGPSLWYLSQRIVVEQGAELLDAGLSRLRGSLPSSLDDAVRPSILNP